MQKKEVLITRHKQKLNDLLKLKVKGMMAKILSKQI